MVVNYCYLPVSKHAIGRCRGLVQEAFVRIWRLYGHTGEVSPSLVYRAIRRLAIDWARSLDRRKIREQKVFLESHICFF